MRYTVTKLAKAPKDRLVVRLAADCWLVGDYADSHEVLMAIFPDKSLWKFIPGRGWNRMVVI